MISLEQVRQLDIRVKKTVTAVKNLSGKNNALKKRNTKLEHQLEELNKEASTRKASEQELEVSLQGVLDVLDEVDRETSNIEPEAPEENYVIDTVSLDEEADDPVSDEPADNPTSEDVVSAHSADQTFDFDIVENVDVDSNADSSDQIPDVPEIQEEIIPLSEEPEALDEAVAEAENPSNQHPSGAAEIAEEVPGVGQIVEFTNPETIDNSTEENEASPTDETEETEPKKDISDSSAEEINLDNDATTTVEGEDDFQSEFEIF